MHILYITPLYPNVGRTDLFDDTSALHYFVRQWTSQGHKVTVLHTYMHNFYKSREYKLHYGIRIEEAELDGAKIFRMENRFFMNYDYIRKAQMLFVAKRYRYKLKDYLKANPPDVMLVHTPAHLNEFVRSLKIDCPCIGILHMTDIKRLRKRGERLRKQFDDFYAGLGFRSKSIKESFELMVSYGQPKFLVYSGAPHIGSGDVEHKEVSLDKPKLLYVGKLIKRKNTDVLIKAISHLKSRFDFHLTIIGEGPERKSLERLILDLKLTDCIEIIGKMSRESVLEHMSKADIFVMVSRQETFGLVYLEAMSQKCITIGSKGEGIDGIIKDGENGFLVDTENVEVLVNRLENIFTTDINELKKIANNAYNTALDMTEENMATRYLSTVEKIIMANGKEKA